MTVTRAFHAVQAILLARRFRRHKA